MPARTTLIVALIISWNALIPAQLPGPRRLQVWIPSLAAGGSPQAQPPSAAAPPQQGPISSSSSPAAPPPATILNLPPGLMPRQPRSSSSSLKGGLGWGFSGGWAKQPTIAPNNWFWSSFPSPFSFQTSTSWASSSASAATASITSMAAAGNMDQLPHTTLETAATLEQAGLVAIAVNKGGQQQQQAARRDTVPMAAPAAASSTDDASGSGQGGSGTLAAQSQGGDLKAQAAAGGAASAGSGNEPAAGFFAQASTRVPAYSQGVEGQQQQRQPKRALLHLRV